MTHIETRPATAPRATARAEDRELIPRAMMRAMLALVLIVLALVSYARITDRPLEATPPAGAITAERQVILSGDLAGAVEVRAADGSLIVDLPPEKGGFISGVHRVILRERTKHRVAQDTPVTLLRRDTGRIEIYDPATGWSADLMGFGADNARAFARLLAF